MDVLRWPDLDLAAEEELIERLTREFSDEQAPAEGDDWWAQLDDLAPGLVLAALLDRLDRLELTGFERVEVLRARERMVSHYQAGLYADVDDVARAVEPDSRYRRDHYGEFSSEEIQAALGRTRRGADRVMELAYRLRQCFPAVWGALSRGKIDLAKARVLVEAVVGVDDSIAGDVVDRALSVAGSLTTGQLRARVNRMVIEADPEAARSNCEAGLEERRMVRLGNPDGTADLGLRQISAVDAAEITARVGGLAHYLKSLPGEERTMDQIRADVSIDLLLGRGSPQAHRTVVDVRIAPDALRGLAETPAHLGGFGPLLADMARELIDRAEDVELRAHTTGEGGGYTAVASRRPSTAQRRMVETHYSTCVFPGCRVPSADCDIDHRRPHAIGGPTECSNLEPLCRRHHRCKDEGGWGLARSAGDDGHSWTSPLGHTYRVSRGPP